MPKTYTEIRDEREAELRAEIEALNAAWDDDIQLLLTMSRERDELRARVAELEAALKKIQLDAEFGGQFSIAFMARAAIAPKENA